MLTKKRDNIVLRHRIGVNPSKSAVLLQTVCYIPQCLNL